MSHERLVCDVMGCVDTGTSTWYTVLHDCPRGESYRVGVMCLVEWTEAGRPGTFLPLLCPISRVCMPLHLRCV